MRYKSCTGPKSILQNNAGEKYYKAVGYIMHVKIDAAYSGQLYKLNGRKLIMEYYASSYCSKRAEGYPKPSALNLMVITYV